MSENAPRYEIILERQAEKFLNKLPASEVRRLDSAIVALADTPRPPGCKKMKEYDNLYRIRVGDWRIVYAIEDDQLIILVVRIGPRGSVYKNL